MCKIETKKTAEYFVAIGSFLAAVGLAFTSLIISEEHDIEAGVLMMCAQFLMLCAAIFGLDYKLWTHDNFVCRKGGRMTQSDNIQDINHDNPK